MQIVEKFTKRKFFFKLVISFVVLSLLIVLCISILFASVYIKDIRKQITDEYLGSLERASGNIENITREIDQLYTYMQLNLDIYVFLNLSENNAEAENTARIQAKLISQINPYIRSVHLYNAKTEALITVGKQDFDIQSIKNIGNNLESHKNMNRNILLTKLDKPSVDNNDRIMSIIYTENDMNNDMLGNMIIVDLEEKQLRNEILDRYEGETLLVGSDGTLFSYSNEKPGIFDVKEEDYFKTVSKINNSKGSFVCRIDGENKTVTYHKNSSLNCFIVNIRPYGSIIMEIQQKRNFIIALSLLVILVFSIFSFILSKKIYNPIQKISEVFQDSKYGSAGGYSSEVSLIMDVFKKTESQLEVLERKNKNNISQIKEFYLRQMLRNGQVGAMSEQDLHNYGIDACFKNAVIVDIKIDNYYQIEENERYKYERSVCDQCHLILDDEFYGEFINMFDGQIVAVLRDKDNKSDYSMINILDRLKNSIKEDLYITVTIGVGSVINSCKEFSEAFAQAQDMTKHRFVFGGDRVIYRQMVDTKLSESHTYPSEISDSLIDSIRVNNAEGFVEYQAKLINNLKNYPYQDASEIFFGVALNCIRTINAIIGNNNDDICFNLEEFNRIYFELETLEQAGEWLQNLFNEYRTLMESLKSNKHFLVIEDAKKYIDEHLCDINLCVELLAERAEYTPNYFAKIFKEITGIYINNYIRQMRINKAKLLLENNCKISEIPGMVGFANLSHFYVAFKKDAGLTPALYQKFAMQQKSN